MTWEQRVTLGIAVLGAVLGVFNTSVNFRRDRPRLRISEGLQKPPHMGLMEKFYFEFTNRGRVLIAIARVDLVIGGGLFKRNEIEVWERATSDDIVIEPGRSKELVLPDKLYFRAPYGEHIRVRVITEGGRQFTRRCKLLGPHIESFGPRTVSSRG